MMATTEVKTQLVLRLSDGSVNVINLPEPRNNTLEDDNDDPIIETAYPSIVAAYQSASGATVQSITTRIVTTTTNVVNENYAGT